MTKSSAISQEAARRMEVARFEVVAPRSGRIESACLLLKYMNAVLLRDTWDD